MRKNVALLVVLVFLATSCLTVYLPVKAESKTIVVPDDYLTIQDASANASPGDTVFVRNGNYAGGIALNKPVWLRGEDAKSTFIVGGATLKDLSFNSTIAVQSAASDMSVSALKSFALTGEATQTLDTQKANLKIQPTNFIEPPTFGVYINSSDIKISGFTIKGGTNGYTNAINGNGDRLQIYQNILGTCSFAGSDIIIANNTDIDLQIGGLHNSIVGNIGSLTLVSSNSTILENSLTYFESENANFNNIINNTLSDANMGMWIGSHGKICSYNLFAGNKIENSGLWGILMGAGSYNVFFGNIVENTGVGIGHDGYGLALGGNGLTAEKNLFLRNIFVNNSRNFGVNWPVTGTNSFDDGKEGNYWDDYLTRYSNAVEVDSSGTGNISYMLTEINIDNHPLLVKPSLSGVVPVLPKPWSSLLPVLLPLPSMWSSSPSPSSSPNDSSSPLPSVSSSPTLSISPSKPEFPALTIPLLITIILAAAGLLVYYKHKAKTA
jgi:parallel beta-helix repeat protein